MMPLIRVINPNSNAAITARMAEALAPMAQAGGPAIDCITLDDGPVGVASDADIATAAPLLRDHVANDREASAFVIACYSDPGLSLAREVTDRPVLGIGEAAVATALTLGQKFGVISVSDWSVDRHARDMTQRGLAARCAGDRPLRLSVSDTATPEAFSRIREVALNLRDQDGADVLITACAGLSRHMARLEAETGLPVVDPVRAAVAIAIGVLNSRRAAP